MSIVPKSARRTIHTIETPRGTLVQYQSKGGKLIAKLEWNPRFARTHMQKFSSLQVFIDNDCYRRMDKYTPKRTSFMIKSGLLGTIFGNGEIRYLAAYSAMQYYETATTRGYDPLRGAYWFERMKNAEGDQIRKGAQKLVDRGQA